MKFLVKRRRTAPAVIIVALIDVLIVLVIFLMVTTTFKQQQSLRLALPQSSQAQKSGDTDRPPLTVSIGADGEFFIEKTPRTFEQLQAALRDAVAKNPQVVLDINADEKAPWGQVVKLRDAAAVAKIKFLVALTKDAAKP